MNPIMATPTAHRNKALHNEQFISHHDLGAGEFAGWAVTALFYSAVHWLRALVTSKGLRDVRDYSGENRGAEELLGTGVLDPQAWEWYGHLKDDSRDARYGMMVFTPAEFDEIYRDSFTPFRAFVLNRLKL
jgi:hypothetical protein